MPKLFQLAARVLAHEIDEHMELYEESLKDGTGPQLMTRVKLTEYLAVPCSACRVHEADHGPHVVARFPKITTNSSLQNPYV